jgi:hypothetical protein
MRPAGATSVRSTWSAKRSKAYAVASRRASLTRPAISVRGAGRLRRRSGTGSGRSNPGPGGGSYTDGSAGTRNTKAADWAPAAGTAPVPSMPSTSSSAHTRSSMEYGYPLSARATRDLRV